LLGPGDASTLLYTSGTTGTPKGVLFSHGSTGVGGRHFIEALGLTPDDVLLAVTPLFHGNAWGAVQTALHAGGTVAFPQAFHASEFWPLVHRTRATVLYTLGTILAMLLTRAPSALEQTSGLRVILGLGAAPIRDQVMRRFGDEDGWLYFVDRKRDVIRRGGENVSSVLIEKTLREHPRVAEVAVIGVPDPVLGQEIKAFVVAKEPVTAEELRAFAAERLAK